MKKLTIFLLLLLFLTTEIISQVTLGNSKDGTAPLITEASTLVSTDHFSVKYCRFIPQNTATYTISSTSTSDPYCTLYDQNGQQINYNDDNLTLDFYFTHDLTAGLTYYLGLGNYDGVNDITLNITGGVLPVELISFTAINSSENVLLNWQTATEINNYGFEVERKLLNQVQNDKWETLGFVQGNGNSNSPKNYEFLDESPLVDSAEYRLKQIDTDGNYTYYSETVKVAYGVTDVNNEILPRGFSLSENYPNPFNPSTMIKYGIPEQSNVKIEIFNMLGQSVDVLVNSDKSAGYYETTWNATNLPSGIYLISIKASGLSSSKNFTQVKKALLLK